MCNTTMQGGGARCVVWMVVGASLCVALACVRELTPDEIAFYERASEIRLGAKRETVKHELGEPSRIVKPSADCVNEGGRQEWLYENLVSQGRRTVLPAGAFAFCVDENDLVVSISKIVH